jgi:V-type H+-transporting ATPase subunit F
VTQPPDSQKNFLVVDSKTDNAAIEEAFERFTTERKDIGILLINQHVWMPDDILSAGANRVIDC